MTCRAYVSGVMRIFQFKTKKTVFVAFFFKVRSRSIKYGHLVQEFQQIVPAVVHKAVFGCLKNRHFRRFVLFDFNKRPMKSCSVFLHTLTMMILSLYQVCTASIDELTKRQSRNIAHKAVFGLVLCHACCAARFSLKHNEKPNSFLEHVSMIAVKLLLRLYAWN